jgi:hypothetical protein
MWTNDGINLYHGDCQVGDREATAGEVEAFELSRSAQIKVAEYQAFLDKTEHKFNSDYEPKAGENMTAIKFERKIARDFIRANKP